eukprot:2700634-Lingulodinium_polyedra.AAC.1
MHRKPPGGPLLRAACRREHSGEGVHARKYSDCVAPLVRAPHLWPVCAAPRRLAELGLRAGR